MVEDHVVVVVVVVVLVVVVVDDAGDDHDDDCSVGVLAVGVMTLPSFVVFNESWITLFCSRGIQVNSDVRFQSQVPSSADFAHKLGIVQNAETSLL